MGRLQGNLFFHDSFRIAIVDALIGLEEGNYQRDNGGDRFGEGARSITFGLKV
jgi:hypothetical protein